MKTTRFDGRQANEPRPLSFELRPQRNPAGSVLVRTGNTSVLVAVSLEDKLPGWMDRDAKSGWMTAEYAMHPCAGDRRGRRDGRNGVDGRATEIQRLIGRSLRAAVDLDKLGPRTLNIDCDVLDADGGTRTASITGAFVATAMALDTLRQQGLVERGVLRSDVAAISVGLLEGVPLLDLCYVEDRDAAVDLNVVASAKGAIVEVQGTAEGAPVPKKDFDAMLDLALTAMPEIHRKQLEALERAGVRLGDLLK